MNYKIIYLKFQKLDQAIQQFDSNDTSVKAQLNLDFKTLGIRAHIENYTCVATNIRGTAKKMFRGIRY
jgi:hypothetical protein